MTDRAFNKLNHVLSNIGQKLETVSEEQSVE